MADKLTYIPNDDTQNYPSVDYKEWVKLLDTNLITRNQNSIKVLKVEKPKNKKTLIHKLWGVV